jgi:hypothetical protein
MPGHALPPPQGYAEFDQGLAKKFILDPHGLIPA